MRTALHQAKVIRWAEADGDGRQQVVISREPGGASMEGMVLTSTPAMIAARFSLTVDHTWNVRSVRLENLGCPDILSLDHDGFGRWSLNGAPTPQLDGALEPDISVTPLTNSFPVRRLALARGESRNIVTAYIDVETMRVFADDQRYTCLIPEKRYRYESLDSAFTRDIEFDSDGYVETYPGLFRRIGNTGSG